MINLRKFTEGVFGDVFGQDFDERVAYFELDYVY